MTDPDAIAARQREYGEGDRVRAVNFVLDEGLRIWPIQNQDLGTARENWRVVQVADQRVTDTLAVGPFHRCQEVFRTRCPASTTTSRSRPGPRERSSAWTMAAPCTCRSRQAPAPCLRREHPSRSAVRRS